MTTFEKKPTKAEVISAMAERTGLNRETIKDLMKQGWTYLEEPNSPRMFAGPELKARKR